MRSAGWILWAPLTLGCSSSASPAGLADAGGGGDDVQEAGAPPDGAASDDGGADSGGKSGCSGVVPLTYGAPTDRMPHPAAPPALGPAGSIVKDPVYGTSILRLTDATTLDATTSFRVANEFWGNDWSTDAKLFYLQESKGAFLPYTLDPVKLVAARVVDKTNQGTPLRMPLAPGGFSRTEATVFYGLKGMTVAKFDFATQTTTNVVDLTTIVPGATGGVLGVQHGASGLLTASFGGPQQDKMPYVVTYDPASGAHHVVDVTMSTLDGMPVGTTIGGGVHTFKIDASGAYVVFSVNGGASTDWLWDVSAGTVKALSSLGAVGWQAWEHRQSGESYEWEVSTFASPTTSASLVTPALSPTDSLASSSVSWESAAGGPSTPLIVETMRPPNDMGPWRAWDQEIVAVRTDGSQSEVWRFAHNFNTYSGSVFSDAYYYLFIPRVSQNGWFVLFDSNWNGTLGTDATGNPRTDAFIVALPNPCGP
jgi:hypothetical protein